MEDLELNEEQLEALADVMSLFDITLRKPIGISTIEPIIDVKFTGTLSKKDIV